MDSIQNFCKKRFNSQVIGALFEECKSRDTFFSITPDFFQNFIKLNDDDFSVLISALIDAKAEEIMEKISSGKWTRDSDVISYLATFIEMIAFGVVCVNQKGEFCYTCPEGHAPGDSVVKEIEDKIVGAVPLISRCVEDFIIKTKGEKT